MADEQTQRLGPSRARVLALLQDAGEPMSADQVGDRLGMHANSVRFHLDALASDGLVVRGLEARTTRGRPRVTYAASASAPRVTRRRYQLLAGMLAGFLAEQVPEPAAVAERTGRDWSRSLPMPERRRGEDAEQDALDVLVGSLDEVGFESRAVEDAGELRIEVSHCPFLEVAEEHEDVVCALHLGLMRGVLERRDAPLGVRDLAPLVEPGLCLAHLSR
ncbi:MAG TPA: helix-turn-helix domain-containing protein [Marmoricola sp.]|nr:helix-turn-helix domain-containing protein [Marmoricola sp.]